LGCASHLPLLHFLFLFFSIRSSLSELVFLKKKYQSLYFINCISIQPETLIGDVFRGMAGVNTSQEKIKHTAFNRAVGQKQMQ